MSPEHVKILQNSSYSLQEEQAKSRLTSSLQTCVLRAAFKQEAEAHTTSNCKVRPTISHEKQPSEEKLKGYR